MNFEINDRDYELLRSAGEFPVAKRQKEMRAQRLQNANNPQLLIDVCYGVGF